MSSLVSALMPSAIGWEANRRCVTGADAVGAVAVLDAAEALALEQGGDGEERGEDDDDRRDAHHDRNQRLPGRGNSSTSRCFSSTKIWSIMSVAARGFGGRNGAHSGELPRVGEQKIKGGGDAQGRSKPSLCSGGNHEKHEAHENKGPRRISDRGSSVTERCGAAASPGTRKPSTPRPECRARTRRGSADSTPTLPAKPRTGANRCLLPGADSRAPRPPR